MITIDAPISFLLGTGLALASSKQKSADRGNVFYKGFILQSCILSPVILFFMLRFPDWEWNYFFDAQRFFLGPDNISIGATSIAILLALLNASYILGFKLASTLIDSNKVKILASIIVGTSALIVIIMLALLDQTLHIGTLAEFQAQSAGLIFLNRDFLIAQAGAVFLLTAGFLTILKTK